MLIRYVSDQTDDFHASFTFLLMQISTITMDNASNNQAMMRFLEAKLSRVGVPFNRDGNRVRYAICRF